MATAESKKVTQVHMTYELDKAGKVTFLPAKLHLKAGDLVNFVCAQGELSLLFEPADAYDPPTFRSGGAPVVVKKSAKGMIWCGGTFRFGYPAGSTPQEITIDPTEKEYGSVNTPPPDGVAE